jgi:hypothetical protein
MSRHSSIGSVALLACLVLLLGVVIARTAFSASEEGPRALSPIERALAREVQEEVGRSYWVRGGTSTNQVFCDARTFPAAACPGKLFGPRDSERFTIEAVNDPQPDSRSDAWYRVRFDSGKTGYLDADTLRRYIFVEMRHQVVTPPESANQIYELFFIERPEVVLSRIRQRTTEHQAEAARRDLERFDRGGIRVGMTKQQVLNSTWGQPDRIHTRVLGGRLQEQWIYGTSNLFFEDGILAAVQTGR